MFIGTGGWNWSDRDATLSSTMEGKKDIKHRLQRFTNHDMFSDKISENIKLKLELRNSETRDAALSSILKKYEAQKQYERDAALKGVKYEVQQEI